MAMICWYIIIGTVLQCSTPMPAKTAPDIFLDAQNDYKENLIEQHDDTYNPDHYAGLTAPFLVYDTDSKMWQTALDAYKTASHYEQHISNTPAPNKTPAEIIVRNAD